MALPNFLFEVRRFSEWTRVSTGNDLEEGWEYMQQFQCEIDAVFASAERWRQRAIGVAPEELVKVWDLIEDEERKAAGQLDELRLARKSREEQSDS